jgi:hypothetical protein
MTRKFHIRKRQRAEGDHDGKEEKNDSDHHMFKWWSQGTTMTYEESLREISPCRLCGSMGHGMLTRVRGEGTKSMMRLNCPVAEQDIWVNMPASLSPMSYRYEVSRYKLAESLGYDCGRITQAMMDYKTHGEGRFQSRGALLLMEGSLKYICEAYHSDQKSDEDQNNSCEHPTMDQAPPFKRRKGETEDSLS